MHELSLVRCTDCIVVGKATEIPHHHFLYFMLDSPNYLRVQTLVKSPRTSLLSWSYNYAPWGNGIYLDLGATPVCVMVVVVQVLTTRYRR
jgi:hypothetical protein